jgi:polyhydroxyalkanoate synthase subunit PhaC
MKKLIVEEYLRPKASFVAEKAQAVRRPAGLAGAEIDPPARELVWQQGKVKLFRFSRRDPAMIRTPVLLVYAFVKREYMQPIQPSRAFVRYLRQQGLDLYMIDWGHASRADRFFSLNDYLNDYLDGAVDFLRGSSGFPKINLLGVCQGGTFSVIYGAIHPQKVKNLVTIATPVSFPAADNGLFRRAYYLHADWMEEVERRVQPAFVPLSPLNQIESCSAVFPLVEGEQTAFYSQPERPLVTGGQKQASVCFRQVRQELFAQNKLVKGTLQVGPYTVNLRYLRMPILNICAEEDNLVPLHSATALNEYAGSTDKTLRKIKRAQLQGLVGPLYFPNLMPDVGSWLKNRD